jgi:3-dehydroquinate synthase
MRKSFTRFLPDLNNGNGLWLVSTTTKRMINTKMKILPVKLAKQYHIFIDENLLQSTLLVDHCSKLSKSLVIIADRYVAEIYGKSLQEKLNAELFVFDAVEKNKTRETKQQLEDELLRRQYGRDTCLIALGGGVVSDIVGYIAATYCRGVPVVYVPTTLLAMVDASIGGKTGVNTAFGKNTVGIINQPQAVFIDTYTLHTLSEREWRNGMAEVIKHSLITDAIFFDYLRNATNSFKQRDKHVLNKIISTSCEIKTNIVEQDVEELGIRQILNFGHTIGHAIEVLEEYQIGHGEAVAIGLVVESYLSVLCGFLKPGALVSIIAILRDYHMSLHTIAFEDKAKFLEVLQQDKKTLNKIIQFVLLDDIGMPHQEHGHYSFPVEFCLLERALDWAKQFVKC